MPPSSPTQTVSMTRVRRWYTLALAVWVGRPWTPGESGVMRIHKIASGLGCPDGPARFPDGGVAFGKTYRSQVSAYRDGRGVEQFWSTGRGPSVTTLGSGGFRCVTRSEGFDGPCQTEAPRPRPIQRVAADARVEVLLTEVDSVCLRAPNHSVFGPDERLHFTDPGLCEADRPDALGCVFALDTYGATEVLAETPSVNPNGIVAESDGSCVRVEPFTPTARRSRAGSEVTLQRVLDNPAPVPDGLTLDGKGGVPVMATSSGGMNALRPDGRSPKFLPVGHVPTNCAFGPGGRLSATNGEHSGTASADWAGSLIERSLLARGRPRTHGCSTGQV